MKKNYFLWLLCILFGSTLTAQVSYSGNGNSGFDGSLGGSVLAISDDGTTLTFDFTTGGNPGGNVIVIYIDSKSGGFTDAESFTDSSDGGRKAVSTVDGSNNPVVTFPAGFGADYAIAIGGSWAAGFELTTGTHNLLSSVDYNSGDPQVSFSDLGITATDKFDYVAILNSQTTYLSNEVIGDTSSIVDDGGGTNPGFSGSITFSDSRSYPNTWTGASSTDWATAGNWTNGIPTSTQNVYIADETNDPIISSTTAATTNNIVTNNVLTINGGGSLIVSGTSSGNVTYIRNIPGGGGTSLENWFLIASPVAGQSAVDFLNDVGDISTNGSGAFAIGTFWGNTWTYDFSGTFLSGVGYAIKKDDAGDIKFTGTINTSDVSQAPVYVTNGFHLLGNPFTSYLPANSNADATNNLLTVNNTILSEPTIWLWDGLNDRYDTYNQAKPAFHIAPGQGFFIEVNNPAGGDFDFTEAMQSHQTDTFQKSAKKSVSNPNISLLMSNGSLDRVTDIYYINGTTTGFDSGYDSSIFGGATHTFEIFTQVVDNSVDKNLAIQSLPDSDYENMVVPVGITAEANTEITFTANTTNIPSGLKVFLEDRETNTFTRLDEANGEYKVTMSQDVNDVGRFYLHTTASALSVPEVHLENVSVYTTHATNIRIEGIALGKTQMKLVNMLGKEVLQQNFSSNGVSDIAIPKLARGIYIVQLNTEKGKLNKKIIID